MTPPFRDPALPRAERVADLLSRLDIDEKLGLMHQYQAPVERLGMAPFKTGTEAAHGVAWLGEATVFPQVLALGATWNPGLVERVGAAVADEVIAKHREDPVKVGRNVWSPTVNPLRHPLWGRNEEGYSEDAWATGVLSAAYARGLKGDNGTAWKTAPIVKHFLAYGHETDRGTNSSNVPPRALHEYELPAQRRALAEGAAVGAMLSYNLVNGRPAHVNPLVNTELRTWTDEEVLVVSDAYGTSMMTTHQHYFEDLLTAYAAAVKAGLDSFTQDDEKPGDVVALLREALDRGLLTEAEIDAAVTRNLSVRFGLGEFDPEDPFARIGPEAVNSPAHRALAREAATQSIVLLKNDGLLPLKAPKRIAVIGPLADTQMEDWYSGRLPYAVTARAGLSERVEVVYHEGVDRIRLRYQGRYVTAVPEAEPVLTAGTGPETQFDLYDWGDRYHFVKSVASGHTLNSDDDGRLTTEFRPRTYCPIDLFRLVELDGGKVAFHQVYPNDWHPEGKWLRVEGDRLVLTTDAEAAAGFDIDVVSNGSEVAVDADAAVVVLGNHPLINGREDQDRTGLALPPSQERLLRAVAAANPNTVLVLSSSYPYAVDWADAHVPAIVWSGHGGQEWGRALADVLFGDRDAEGRLPQTWYADGTALPAIHDCDISATGATYLYAQEPPLYPFGHGLSYAAFTYADLAIDKAAAAPGDRLRVTVEVANTADRDGVAVVQLYSRQCESRVAQPLRQLRGFEKIRLAAGEARSVAFDVAVDDLAHWDNVTGRMLVERSRHEFLAGPSATDLKATGSVHIEGEAVPARDLDGPLAATACDAYAGVRWRDANRESGDVIAAEEPGAWITLGDCDFRDGRYTAVTVRVAGPAARLTLRAGGPGGDLLAEVETPDTGGVYDYADVTAGLAAVQGVADLHVTFAGAGLRLASLAFGEDGR